METMAAATQKYVGKSVISNMRLTCIHWKPALYLLCFHRMKGTLHPRAGLRSNVKLDESHSTSASDSASHRELMVWALPNRGLD